MKRMEMIRKKIEVEDPGQSSIFEDRPERPARLERQAVVLIGLYGGKAAQVGEELARRLECEFAAIAASDREEQLERELTNALDRGRVVASLPAAALRWGGVRGLLRGRAKVFYLMASVFELLGTEGGSEAERERLAEEMRELEPLCMEAMHFMLPEGRSVEGTVADALDKASL
jgi:hypothetical protein